MRRALAASVLCLAAALCPAALAAPTPPLGHSGRWITDAKGRAVILHGLNMVYKVGSYEPASAGFGADDARFLQRNGFDTVRLGIIYKGLAPKAPTKSGQTYDRSYLESIAKTQRTLGRHGIFSLLDFHQDLFNERFQGEGFPDWAVQDDGLPAQPQVGFPGDYLVMPALWRAFDHFWANDPGPGGVGLQDRYAAAWRHVAGTFRGAPYVLGYDLFNEPFPGTPWEACANPAGCPALDQTLLDPFADRVIGQIRKVDPQTLTFYEPWVTFDFGAQTSQGDAGDPHAAMSFHDYCLPAGLGFGTLPAQGDGCRAAEDLVFQNAESQSQKTGDALLLSEYGATDDLATLRRITDLADQHMVSWQEWAYCACEDPTGSGAAEALVVDASKPPRGKNVDRRKLSVLERPYPQAVAGTPEAFSYDPGTDTFDLTYSAVAPNGQTLSRGVTTKIFVPPLHYPNGYHVKVTGGTVVSDRGARYLLIRRDADASEVSVEVTPAGATP